MLNCSCTGEIKMEHQMEQLWLEMVTNALQCCLLWLPCYLLLPSPLCCTVLHCIPPQSFTCQFSTTHQSNLPCTFCFVLNHAMTHVKLPWCLTERRWGNSTSDLATRQSCTATGCWHWALSTAMGSTPMPLPVMKLERSCGCWLEM